MRKLGFGSGLRKLGFSSDSQPSGPILSANFVTGEYQQNGVASTFNDSFDFSRAGKAWLVKDTGLKEYAVDVPRFDSGLLIEQSATNLSTNSNLMQSLATGSIIGGVWVAGGGYSIPATSTSATVFNYLSALNGSYVLTLWIKGVIPVVWPNASADFYASIQGAKSVTVKTVGNLSTVATSPIAASGTVSIGLSRPDTDLYLKREYTLKYWQFELGRGSTLIKTSGTATTRPADFLSATTTGTTITGDWDATLSLSIVGGQLVHSGYGYLRSLEIN